MKILRKKYVVLFQNSYIILLICTTLNFFCTPFSSITKVNKKDFNKITKIKKFTVLIQDASGKEEVNLESLRAGFFFNPRQLNIKGIKKLNSLYGTSIAQILRDKNPSKTPIQYIPPEKLYLIKPIKGEVDQNKDWLNDLEIDAVFTIQQDKLILDYYTRVPELGPLNMIYTFLLLDLWYIDYFGQWYLKNDFSYTIYFPKTGKSIVLSGISRAELLGEYRFSEISVLQIEKTLQSTILYTLGESLNYVE